MSTSDLHASAAQTAVIVIPARGGSRGIPLKNLERVGGTSLIGRAVRTARAVPSAALVVVSTDHPAIAAEARRHGAQVIERPADLASDTAGSEGVVLHALEVLAADGVTAPVTVLMQCTSPFIDALDVELAIRRVAQGRDDVVLAATPSHAFHWVERDGAAVARGHDAAHRPRRQDRETEHRETGAFYAMRTTGLQEHRHRFFGQVALQLVPGLTAIEIDTPADLTLSRALAATLVPAGGIDAIDADAVVTDFDGVHTDDHASVATDGTEHVRVHRGDGLGVAALRRAGVPLLILSTERDRVVAARGRKLGVETLHGVEDKAAVLSRWITDHGLDPARVVYVGNDVNDLGAMAVVGWPVAVADAHPTVRAAARHVLSREGGDGAVREVCDLVLAALPSVGAPALPERHPVTV